MKKNKATDFPQFPGFPFYFGTHIENKKVLLKSQGETGEQSAPHVRDTEFRVPLLKDKPRIKVAVFHRNTAAKVFKVSDIKHNRLTKHDQSQIRVRLEWVDAGKVSKVEDHAAWLRRWPTDIHITVIGELDVPGATRRKTVKKTKK